MIVSILRLFVIDVVCFHTSVGFLLFYLIWWAMRRPLLVNNQRRSALFLCAPICIQHMSCAQAIHARLDTIIAYMAKMEIWKYENNTNEFLAHTANVF